MTKLPEARFRSRACIHFKDKKGNLRACERVVSKKTLEAMASGDSIPTTIRRRGTSESYDFERMKLMNLTTAEEEDILIEFPWIPKSLISVAAKGDENLKRQVLMMALDQIRERPSLRKILTMKGLPTCEIRENPYLCPGHPPYDKFVESLYNFFFEDKTTSEGRTYPKPTLVENFLDCASEDASDDTFTTIERQNIRMVFHGTNPAVMDAILFSGLDPRCRVSWKDRDFFGVQYHVSCHYTEWRMKQTNQPLPSRAKLKVLLFMVIRPSPCQDTSLCIPPVGHFLTVNSIKFELPLAEITLNVVEA